LLLLLLVALDSLCTLSKEVEEAGCDVIPGLAVHASSQAEDRCGGTAARFPLAGWPGLMRCARCLYPDDQMSAVTQPM